MATYSYALDEKGTLVHINDVIKNERHMHTYTCLGCKKELIPRLGNTNIWHFAHKSEEACNGETYLHRLAKYALKKKFYTKEKFDLVMVQTTRCSFFNNCKFKDDSECKTEKPNTYDLKKGNKYDICDVEVPICNGDFQPDVLISDSTRTNKDVLIEIWVTHKSSEEKRNLGLPIIEIRLKNETQITELQEKPIGYSGATYTVEYINFDKESKKTIEPPLVRRIIDYFHIDHTGRAHIEEGRCESQYRDVESEVFKLAIDYSWGTRNNYLVALLYCLKNNKKTCFCPLCFFSGTSQLGPICKLYRTKGTPHFPMKLPVVDCPYFKIDKGLANKLELDIKDAIIYEIN